MPRVSKRAAKMKDTSIQKENKIYYVGIYARLSSDKNELKNESIDTQVNIIRKFIADYNNSNKNEMIIFDIYKDLGKTGTNFARMDFMRLMEDIRQGEVNCVIVKDFSRFGRDYMEVGNYIEKIFPFLGVRFISLADQYDTQDPKNGDRKFAMNVKNLVNEMYARDFSKKGKVQLQQRRKKGSYVGGITPYGYSFEWVGKVKKLRIDEQAAEVVRFIFLSFCKEKNYAAVTRRLNEKKINPPFIYYKTKEIYCRSDTYQGWDKGAVSRILSSKAYIGILEQGKTEITLKRIEKKVEENHWIRIKAHDPIVEKPLFDEVQKIREDIKNRVEKQNKSEKKLSEEVNVFHDILYCGICKRKLLRHSNAYQGQDGKSRRWLYYECKNTYNNYKNIPCESNRIREDILIHLLLKQIKKVFAGCIDWDNTINNDYNDTNRVMKKKYNRALEEVKRKIKMAEKEKADLYMYYKEGMVDEINFITRKNQLDHVLNHLNIQHTELAKKAEIHLSKSKQDGKKTDIFWKTGEKEPVTKELIHHFVERIYLYPDKRVELILSFRNPFIV